MTSLFLLATTFPRLAKDHHHHPKKKKASSCRRPMKRNDDDGRLGKHQRGDKVIVSGMMMMNTNAILKYFTRPLKCEACFGYNRRTCEDCLGRGQENNVLDGEEKTKSCSTCNGKGYVGCAACDGTGLKNGWLFTVKGGWGPRGE
jgi:DnaJ-class molecular chaperone